jgi:hypothetical protein
MLNEWLIATCLIGLACVVAVTAEGRCIPAVGAIVWALWLVASLVLGVSWA